MGIKWSLFAQLAQALAPMTISILNPKLTPLAGAIGNGIAEAEMIPGAKGPEKLQHVLDIANQATVGINNTAGKQVIDPTNLNLAATEAVNTTVSILNLIHPVATANGVVATSQPTVTK